ncbi:MAG: helix-turn-helix transcriptional regulator [Candidatus Pacebacteria bacterium]|jgi:ribosome-binding protein aMBF1 (putative translation factor)|nr:helix-turn-helix transcriptional regulator [Candidatus Paceibacterota bacterium]MBT4652490.1 helix-turn-helix transcriptional regulator [Candidatus Paceibacterota bacterium]MBT6756317.1 helix-turn-helix transcriptional regulator [Candidatus Paceibacterota bacterium]MBT6921608.1 helix-turn-helix transcriptional regulator [Candidatus Paceibacterota bacterium]
MPLDKQRKSLSTKEKQLITNIKHARLDSDLTQEELSYQISKNSNYIGMMESYRRGISLKTLFKIATVLDIKTQQLFENI